MPEHLSTAGLEAAVASARRGLDRAQARLAAVRGGARVDDEEMRRARAQAVMEPVLAATIAALTGLEARLDTLTRQRTPLAATPGSESARQLEDLRRRVLEQRLTNQAAALQRLDGRLPPGDGTPDQMAGRLEAAEAAFRDEMARLPSARGRAPAVLQTEVELQLGEIERAALRLQRTELTARLAELRRGNDLAAERSAQIAVLESEVVAATDVLRDLTQRAEEARALEALLSQPVPSPIAPPAPTRPLARTAGLPVEPLHLMVLGGGIVLLLGLLLALGLFRRRRHRRDPAADRPGVATGGRERRVRSAAGQGADLPGGGPSAIGLQPMPPRAMGARDGQATLRRSREKAAGQQAAGEQPQGIAPSGLADSVTPGWARAPVAATPPPPSAPLVPEQPIAMPFSPLPDVAVPMVDEGRAAHTAPVEPILDTAVEARSLLLVPEPAIAEPLDPLPDMRVAAIAPDGGAASFDLSDETVVIPRRTEPSPAAPVEIISQIAATLPDPVDATIRMPAPYLAEPAVAAATPAGDPVDHPVVPPPGTPDLLGAATPMTKDLLPQLSYWPEEAAPTEAPPSLAALAAPTLRLLPGGEVVATKAAPAVPFWPLPGSGIERRPLAASALRIAPREGDHAAPPRVTPSPVPPARKTASFIRATWAPPPLPPAERRR